MLIHRQYWKERDRHEDDGGMFDLNMSKKNGRGRSAARRNKAEASVVAQPTESNIAHVERIASVPRQKEEVCRAVSPGLSRCFSIVGSRVDQYSETYDSGIGAEGIGNAPRVTNGLFQR